MSNMFQKLVCFFLLFPCSCYPVFAGNFEIYDADKAELAGASFDILHDKTNIFTVNKILKAKEFTSLKKSIPIVYNSEGTVWFRSTITNKTQAEDIEFYIQYFNISDFTIFKQIRDSLAPVYIAGYNNRAGLANNAYPEYRGRLNLAAGETAIYYIKIKNVNPIVFPIYIGSSKAIDDVLNVHHFIIYFYAGILCAILFYNIFLYFSIRDKNYLLYCLYILCLLLAQYTLLGYTHKYIWFEYHKINDYAVPVTSALAGFTAILFTIFFLRTRHFTPRLHKVFLLIMAVSVIIALLSLAGYNSFSYRILDVNNLLAGITALCASFYIARKGYRPAYFYFVSWLFFAVGIIVFSLRNLNILPANTLTSYIIYIGTSLETIFLSIALADKINLLQKEKEVSQANALKVSRENEKLVREQNIVLEQRVNIRTEELQDANSQLNNAITNLKDAQTQLVDAEKMASLGQLTAGIAHEINNPINFVKSNINPLKLDFNDLITLLEKYIDLHKTHEESAISDQLKELNQYQKSLDIPFIKEEITNLIKGIEDGAERTAEIVRGLRTFTRIDESALKKVDIHDGINSTLVILKNSTPFHVQIIKNFQSTGLIECFPGKINQVFMNIFNNAFQAMNNPDNTEQKDYLTIETKDIDHKRIRISVKDTGTGMTPDIKKRIFEPFFTTKEVGEGTGLGLAIVYKIIQKHHGTIEVNTAVGKGTEFVITLPLDQAANISL